MRRLFLQTYCPKTYFARDRDMPRSLPGDGCASSIQTQRLGSLWILDITRRADSQGMSPWKPLVAFIARSQRAQKSGKTPKKSHPSARSAPFSRRGRKKPPCIYFCLIISFSSWGMSRARRDELWETPASVHLIPLSRVRWRYPRCRWGSPEQKGIRLGPLVWRKKKGDGGGQQLYYSDTR